MDGRFGLKLVIARNNISKEIYMQKVIDFFNNTFGSIGKWILLGIFGLVVILGIVLVSYVLVNLKWILLGASILIVIAVVGLILYKKFGTNAPAAPVAPDAKP